MAEIETLAADIRSAASIIVFSGAGASADSGIPTFRGRGSGWWTSWLGFAVLPWFGTPFGWRCMPTLTNWITFNLYHHFFFKTVVAANPNAFHRFLGRLVSQGRDVRVMTQNVDALHQRGGVPSDLVCEIHGTVLKNICVFCFKPIPDGRLCMLCGGYARPAATLFFENCPLREINKIDAWFTEKTVPLVLVVGLSGNVGTSDYYIYEYKNRGCKMYNINPGESKYEKVASVQISRGADDVFSELEKIWESFIETATEKSK